MNNDHYKNIYLGNHDYFKRGLAQEPGLWPWSSYSFYEGLECVFPVDRLFEFEEEPNLPVASR